MNPPKELTRHQKNVLGEITDLGDGYFKMFGYGAVGEVAYIALPDHHSDVGKHYDDLDVDVNGGLTYSDGCVFGWDYAHGFNTFDFSGDFERALSFFKQREKS